MSFTMTPTNAWSQSFAPTPNPVTGAVNMVSNNPTQTFNGQTLPAGYMDVNSPEYQAMLTPGNPIFDQIDANRAGGGGGGGFGMSGPPSFNAPQMGTPRLPNPFGAQQTNSPYPERIGPPNSQVITNPLAGFGSVADWETDWQNRYNAEAARAGEGATSGSAGTWMNFAQATPEQRAQATDWRSSGERIDPANPFGTSVTELFIGGSQGSPGYTPNFDPFYQERDTMVPLFENQTARQQAYDNMAGLNSPNAMLPANYTAPGFGQVSGQSNPYAPEMGGSRAAVQGADDAISNDFLSGLYDPQTMQATGVYRPPGSLGGLGGMGGPF